MFSMKHRLMEEAGEGGGGGGEPWYAPIAGEDATRTEVLKQFETPDAFFTKFDELSTARSGETDWRKTIAGEDEKTLKALNRFTKPEDFGKAYLSAADRIRAGDVLKPLPENPTEDDIKAYREQQGIPAESKDYFEKMPEGLVVAEDDQEFFNSLADALHGLHARPEQVHGIVKWYYDAERAADEALKEKDKTDSDGVAESLRDEWGADYRANINVAKAFLSELPDAAKERFLASRTAEGTLLFNDADIVKFMVGRGRALNPAAAIMPAGQANDKDVDAEYEAIRSKLGTTEYIKNPEMQARYRKLIEIREARKKAAA